MSTNTKLISALLHSGATPETKARLIAGALSGWTLADDPDLAREVREDEHDAECERMDREDREGE